MKKYLLLAICVLFTAGNTFAYIRDKVMVTSTSSPDNDAVVLARLYMSEIAGNLQDRFRCLDPFTQSDISYMLGFAREQQLIGTPEEQSLQLKNLGDAMGAKYLILADVKTNEANSTMSVAIKGINNKNLKIIFRMHGNTLPR